LKKAQSEGEIRGLIGVGKEAVRKGPIVVAPKLSEVNALQEKLTRLWTL